ncbi:hypothetical protein Desde_3195 [Desulfitobacterium dehalogenans ATCC 51507]|uniref:Uncharacterized protein n=1 Tax=Desulfitobacterium dehalogenans (strain ATCC 51507 / DSM 9161 / JW/IU-DC1) TaxID=756499 RepID=I4AC01_DESDJ|nr:hypothetical protein [Desulfitobacterium dehalogenans]AFM01486.1 hypothetical protein Desde_3195 [Desulfitobacterium dehalogenans ATCC 51507]
MDIKQHEPEGVHLGISGKVEIVKLDYYKERRNDNAVIMAKAGRGMNYIHKANLVSRFQEERIL